jgi:hypothetical protein
MRAYVIANILSMLAMLIGVINVFTFREIWVLFAAAAILVILAIYTVKEKHKLKQQQSRQETNNHNSQSTIHNPQFTIHNSQSTIHHNNNKGSNSHYILSMVLGVVNPYCENVVVLYYK